MASATRHSAHRPAQHATTQWGRDTSIPDALKTAHFKKHSQILTFCQHNTAQKFYIGAYGKAKGRTIRRVAQPSVWQGIGGGTVPPPMH